MANNGGHLTLIDLLLSFAIAIGVGRWIAGAMGILVAAAALTVFIIWAILRAASAPDSGERGGVSPLMVRRVATSIENQGADAAPLAKPESGRLTSPRSPII